MPNTLGLMLNTEQKDFTVFAITYTPLKYKSKSMQMGEGLMTHSYNSSPQELRQVHHSGCEDSLGSKVRPCC